jgi:type I restriction enzyme S subunit
MEMMPGYKHTELGPIPEDWDLKPLGEFGSFKKGRNIPKGRLSTEGRPCVLYGEIYTTYDCVANELVSRIPDEIAQQSTPILYGDILFAGSGETAEEIGKCFAYTGREKAFAGGDLIILSPEEADSSFLGYQLNSVPACKQKAALGQGSSVVHIYVSQLAAIWIPTPPTVAEQRAIAAVLSDIDALITSLDRLIAKKRDIKQAAMQQLLTGKTRLPGFCGQWQVKKLHEVAEVIDPHPSHRAPTENKNGIPFVGIGDISTNGSINYETARFVPESVFDEHSERYNLADNLLGIGRVASIGKVVRLLSNIGKYTLSPTIAVINPLNVNPSLLFHCLLAPATLAQFNRIKSGSTRQAVGITILREIEVLLPKSPEEQEAIGVILSDMDAEIAALERRRDKTLALRQGMMQELLTGRTRLV